MFWYRGKSLAFTPLRSIQKTHPSILFSVAVWQSRPSVQICDCFVCKYLKEHKALLILSRNETRVHNEVTHTGYLVRYGPYGFKSPGLGYPTRAQWIESTGPLQNVAEDTCVPSLESRFQVPCSSLLPRFP